MKITPTLDQVLIEKIRDEKSKGGIILIAARSNSLPSEKGKIIAIGRGRHENGVFVETTLKPGQLCLYHAYPSGVEVADGGKDYILIQEKQVTATYTD